ncbi:energy transducer TonB [Sporomusa sp.]|uniref:energy transducer TonB n=1 Tax=Sporomusa sp. TaxID=2078658 RepID=UPI002BA390DA|nr:energy transducer TonB [Sporomusa sp.]HWR09206.1 energy transducer TonB [Sporomusa sp.]
MEWATGSRWRKAMIISLVFHGIVLMGVGWLAVRALLPVTVPETVIELELASEPEGAPMPAAAAAAPVQTSQAVTAPVPTPVVRQVQPDVVVPDEIVSEPAVIVSSMAVVAVDSAAAAGGGQAGGAGSGGGTGQSGTGTGAGGTGTEKGIIPPNILSKREPSYPERARQNGQEGTVVLRIEIRENGRAGQISVQKSSGYELLDDAAADSVQRWRFVPAKVRETGQAIACSTTLPIVFKLH